MRGRLFEYEPYFWNLLLKAAMHSKPEPIRSIVAGSGTLWIMRSLITSLGNSSKVLRAALIYEIGREFLIPWMLTYLSPLCKPIFPRSRGLWSFYLMFRARNKAANPLPSWKSVFKTGLTTWFACNYLEEYALSYGLRAGDAMTS